MPASTGSTRDCRVFISAGEVSGDLAGAHLALALRRLRPRTILIGVGGWRMEEAGVQIVFRTSHLGSVGLTEPLAALPELFKTLGVIRRQIRLQRPDVAVLIGNDVFHVGLARWLRSKQIPTVSYLPPQVWLWQRVARPIAGSFDWILTSFAAEQRIYEQAGGRAVFVGHYLRDTIREVTPQEREQARSVLGLRRQGTTVALLPGSRVQEVRALTPLCLEAAQRMVRQKPSLEFILPLADACFEAAILEQIRLRGLEEEIRVNRDSRLAMTASDLLLVASGTATLEAMLLGLPMIVFYRLSRATHLAVRLLIAAGLIESETIGLPNLLAGRNVVPELCLRDVSASRLSEMACSWLDLDHQRSEMRQHFRSLAAALGEPGSLRRAAQVVLQAAGGPVPDSVAL